MSGNRGEIDVGRQLRDRVLGGERIPIDTLTDAELVSMQTLIFNEEAEIINSACKPFLVARAERFLLPP